MHMAMNWAKVPYGLRDPKRVLPSGSLAWPVMHMAMNWALGSFRDSSTVRGGLGLLLLRSSVKFTCTRPLYIATIPSGSRKAVAWPVMHMAMNWALGSCRDNSTMRGGSGLFLLRE